MKYLIIGNGVAGTTAAAHIRNLDKEGSIRIITEEAYPYYSRIRLIHFLGGEVDEKDLVIKKADWYEEQNIELSLNTEVVDIDINKKEVFISPDDRIHYDRLLLATGGVSFVPPISGANSEGVFTLRTLKDANEILDFVKKGNNRVVMIGGGVLGLEAGNGLRKSGCDVSVVEFFPRLLPRQMDPEGAEILKSQMESMGFAFYLGAKTKEIVCDQKVRSVVLEDGRNIECDIAIISAGVRPNAGLAEKIGLELKKGLVVNDRMETELQDIFAAGDLIQHKEVFYGIWPAAEKQGELAGINMAGGEAVYEGTTMSNMLKVAGVNLFAAGDIDADGKHESVIKKNGNDFIYKKLVIQDNTIIGSILYGDIKEMVNILKAIRKKTDISGMRGDLNEWNLEGLKI